MLDSDFLNQYVTILARDGMFWIEIIVPLGGVMCLIFIFISKQDAAGLTQLSASVEDVFASGDLPRAAETLANMRHCLSAVGEVIPFVQDVILK